MKTRHPVKGSFGSEFPAICNHCWVRPMAAWSRKTLKILAKCLRFFGKTIKRPFTVKFSKSCSESFHRAHLSTYWVQIWWNSWNLANGKWAKSCVIYQIKKFACLSNCRCCADGAQNLPGPAPNNLPRVLQISSKSVHFRRTYSRTRKHRQVNPIFGWSLTSTRRIMKSIWDIRSKPIIVG